jgi:hypothetical protein
MFLMTIVNKKSSKVKKLGCLQIVASFFYSNFEAY